MPADTTIPVSDEVWEALMLRKKRGDTFDDVLRRVLDMNDHETDTGDEPVPDAPDHVEALLAEWSPSTQANDDRARRETARAYRWLAEQTEPQKRSEIVAACAGESEFGERTWWERAVQPGLRYLAEKDLVEYRSGYHDYSVSGGLN